MGVWLCIGGGEATHKHCEGAWGHVGGGAPIGRCTRRCRCWNKASRPGGLTENESAAVRGPRAPSRARSDVDRAGRRDGSS